MTKELRHMTKERCQRPSAESLPSGLETYPTEIEQIARDLTPSRMADLIDAIARDVARRDRERAVKFGLASQMPAGG
jgi:DNA helicase HerA-like ATPase